MFEYLLEPVLGMAKNIFGNRSNFDTMFNLGSEVGAMVYNHQLQNTLFQRDDTAVQRAMKDYQAAGLNPLLGLPNPSGNTKGFESSPLSIDTLGKKQQQTQIDYTKKEQQFLEKQMNDFDKQSSRNREIDQAKINRNKFIAKLLGVEGDYADGIEINDYSAKDLALLAAMSKGRDIINSVTSSDNNDDKSNFEAYREQKHNYSKLTKKEQESIDNSLKERAKALKKVIKSYTDKDYLSVKWNGDYKAIKFLKNDYGIKLLLDDGPVQFYNDTEFWDWCARNNVKVYSH